MEDRIVQEARDLQAQDLERAKAALQAANACGNFDGCTYRIAKVRLDAEPPFQMIVDVDASALDGPRLPEVPLTLALTQETYLDVPPEERGAAPRDAYTALLDKAALTVRDAAVEDFGEHVFATGDPYCLGCGQHHSQVTVTSRCGL